MCIFRRANPPSASLMIHRALTHLTHDTSEKPNDSKGLACHLAVTWLSH